MPQDDAVTPRRSTEWLAGYKAAQEQAAAAAKLYQDELSNLRTDAILQRKLINEDGPNPNGLEIADIANLLTTKAFHTARNIANTIGNLQPPSLDIPVEQIAAAFRTRDDCAVNDEGE